jgi:hypothetical protein
VKIGVLGSGLLGAKLGTILARAGHDRNARCPEPFAPLMAYPDYEGGEGPELADRIERYS